MYQQFMNVEDKKKMKIKQKWSTRGTIYISHLTLSNIICVNKDALSDYHCLGFVFIFTVAEKLLAISKIIADKYLTYSVISQENWRVRISQSSPACPQTQWSPYPRLMRLGLPAWAIMSILFVKNLIKGFLLNHAHYNK